MAKPKDTFKESDFLFCSKAQLGYLKRIKENSLRLAIYYAALRDDYTHPASSSWYDINSDKLERMVKTFDNLASKN